MQWAVPAIAGGRVQGILKPRSISDRPSSKRVHRCHAQPSGDGDASIRDQAKRLDRLFYSDTATDKTAQAGEGDVDGATSNAQPQSQPPLSNNPIILHDLPLWRVQWAVLPGYQEVLHVHVPHYVDLFSRVTAGPRPWLFGHLLLPGGSASLGLPEYTLEPGSKAPLVGAVMEVMQAVKFPDGRMLILAAALGKFKVINPLQLVPHSRADVVILPDDEELLYQSADLSFLFEPIEAKSEAAYHAAVAAAKVWWQYEASLGRVHDSVALIDGDDEEASMAFGRRLVSIGSNEVLKLPFSYITRDISPQAAEKLEGDELRDAGMAAREAAKEVIIQEEYSQNEGLMKSWMGGLSLSGFLDFPINSVEDRGAAPIPESLSSEGDKGEGDNGEGEEDVDDEDISDTIESALLLEKQVWEELDAVLELAHKISGRVAPLAEGLLCLRPPPSAIVKEQEEASGWTGEGAHPEYPALRRAQRLSYAVASTLGSVANSEGRQAWLEASSITERLKMALAALRKHRNVLAAVVAVRKLESGGEEK